MSPVEARLYTLALSHPARAAQRMLQYKRIRHRLIYLLPGLHPGMLRFAGFRGATIPALELGADKVQGSRSISRALDSFRDQPRLFPEDPEHRASVEEAERWGEEDLQEALRRIFRWTIAHQQPVRRWLGELSGVPAPGLAGALNAPLARSFAKRSGADEARVRDDIGRLPSMLDRVDRLIESGVIGSDAPNAADFQIGSSVRVLMTFPQLRPLAEGRPAGEMALRLFRRYAEPIPAALPLASAN
ncbi:MAG: hypothetical protein AVDCRST_MAG17-1378 [uncultured Solirubrobacterales bacterium]|uniref:GST N-terminal domain-containing protein n=1 Tax=uncultured Solirubrobacterales bacterium TaxID=768556 RepID=A0A6J4SMU5_9ACTN|nr:MAG: hypothetical protein AVDCRST_MAG17-1378 [uncultured Solirubrobacterales bacterium]